MHKRARYALMAGMVAAVWGIAAPVARADETCLSPYTASLIKGQEAYLHVWTLGEKGLGDESDKLVTIDADPKSKTYGTVISSVSVGGRGEAGDRRFDLGLAAGDRGRADEVGGDETALLGLDEHQVAAVVFEVVRALRAKMARGLDIGGDGVGERRRHRGHRREAAERLVGGAVQEHRRARACATTRSESIASPGSSTAPPVSTTESSSPRARPASRHSPSISCIPAAAPATSPAVLIQPTPSVAVSARARGPVAAM